MLVLLPLLSLILLFLSAWSPDREWRSAVLSAAVIFGVLVTASTEILSLFRLITFGLVLSFWLLVTIGCGFIYYQLIKKGKRSLTLPTIPRIPPVSLVLLIGIVFLVATVGLICLVAPPNNWDSMTYHMARVVHWIQNQSVAHYPTYYAAQLVHPPFAEFIIMHLQILSGSDRFANLVQWFSMIGSIIGVSLIAKQLGADRRGQILAVVFCVTIPMGILQSSSTQNDYVVGFFLVCLAHHILLVLLYTNYPNPLTSAGIGASLGLAILTKTSGYIYALPLMIWVVLSKLNHWRWKLIKQIGVVTVIALSLNLGHYLRSLDLYGSPIATAEYSKHYNIEVYSLQTWVSNIIRNLSLHVDIVRYLGLQRFITPLTGKVEKLISLIHTGLGVDMNDPRTTFPINSYRVPGISFNENVAGNPLHLLLIVVAIALFLIYKKLRTDKQISGYMLSVIGGFLLLCLLLKIQPYQSRHHLSLFVMFSAIVSLVFCKTWNRHILTVIAVILLVTSMPWVFGNKFRPITAETNIFNTPRNELYFTNRRYLKEPYFQAVNFLKTTDCSNIGLSLGWSPTPSGMAWEYPFWVLLPKNNGQVVRFEHILHPQNITNKKSNIYPFNNFIPCGIITVRSSQDETLEKIMIKKNNYVKSWSVDPISVLMKK